MTDEYGLTRLRQREARAAAGEKSRASNAQTEEEIKYSKVLTDIAAKYGLESPTVIALAYVLRKTPFVFPIIGGRKVEVCFLIPDSVGALTIPQHLEENIKALTIKLTDEEIDEIDGRSYA